MAEHGNPTQWGNTRPTEADISARIARNELFVLEDSDGIHGVFAFILGEDPTYHVIENGNGFPMRHTARFTQSPVTGAFTVY